MTTDKKKPLQKGTERLAALREELAMFPGHEEKLRAELTKRTEGLTHSDRMALIIPTAGSDQTREIQDIAALRLRLELMPGARTTLQRLVQEQEAKLTIDIRNLMGEYRNKSRTRLDELQSQQMQSMLAVCGGDAQRATKAVEQVLANSEAHRWLNLFTIGAGIADPCLHVPWLFKACDRFDAVETADF